MTDRLTGLPGRELLDELRLRFAETASHEPWTVMMIDVDQFKLINDTYGHLLGDLVLAEVGSVLRKNARSCDAVLRYGGDEFAAAFPLTPVSGATNYARRIAEGVSRLVFPHELKVTLSVGVAERLGNEATLDAVLGRADQALYQAKQEGRNRVVVFDATAGRRTRDDLAFSHFVGRERELRALRQMLDESLDQGTRLAVVMGEVGVGKTRLVEELAQYGAFRRCAIQRNACTEFGRVEPYSFLTRPIGTLLASFRPHELEQVQHVVGTIHPSSSPLLPWFPVAEQDHRFFSEDGLKFRVFDDLLRVLHGITMLMPVLLIVEDAQWMGSHDLDLLAYVLRTAGDAALMVVLTVRRDGDRMGSAESILRLARAVPSTSVTLKNLEADEVTSLLALALRDPAVPFEVLGSLHRQSGGNPFFLRELLLALRQEGRILPAGHGGWAYDLGPEPVLPASLTQVISQRLQSLSEPTRWLVRVASLAGGSFPVTLLADAGERPDMEVAACLEEALGAGIIAEDGGPPEPTYRFVHDIVRSYVYRDVPAATRALLHSRMGRYCERLLDAGKDDMLSATAHHYAESADAPKCTVYALRAAKAAALRQAARETLRWLSVYLERVDEGSAPRGDLLYAYRTRGEFLSLIGEGDAADESLSRALELADCDDDRAGVLAKIGDNSQKLSRYADARDRYSVALTMTGDKVARADLLVSIVYLDCLEGRYLDAAVRLEEVRCLLEAARSSPGAPHVWAAYHKRMGDVKQELAGPGEALSHYETALELYRGQGDRVGESAVINNMSSCHSAAGDHERSLELLHDAARLNTQIDDALGLAIAHYNLAETYGSLNQVSLAREYYQRYMDASARIGNELGMGYGHFGLGYLAWLENDLPSAEVSYRDSAEVFRRLGTSQLATMSMIRLVEVLFEQGKFDDGAEELCRLEESLAPDATERRVELCYLEAMHLLLRPAPPHAAPGFPLRATELLTSALERVRPDDVAQVMKCSHFLAKALVANGETDRATQTLERALTAFRAQLARIANHSYRSSLIQGREIRRIREVYEQLTGSRWDPYAQDGG